MSISTLKIKFNSTLLLLSFLCPKGYRCRYLVIDTGEGMYTVILISVNLFLQSSFPITTHAIHIINHSWIFDKIYNIFKPLLNSYIRSKIFFHGHDMTSLHKHILPEHLPKRYGGVWQDYSYTIWLESIRRNYDVTKEVMASGYKIRANEVSPEVLRRFNEEGIKLS